MGTKISELFTAQELTLDDLKGKTLVVDTFNQLYMYLSTIRQSDGSLLKDSHDNVTSHLSGLFFRFSHLMKLGMSFIFVFDGKTPELKRQERERRMALKQEAQLQYEQAEKEGNIEDMKKYAARTSKLTPDMIADAKKLIAALGCPIVQAPAEGEAQAAHIVRQGKAYAVLSQDADSFLFGAPRVVKNLTLSGRRKKPGALAYALLTPELIVLKDNLSTLKITQDQLILMSMLTGTDFNIGGIKGIGPKTALKLVTDIRDASELFDQVKWQDSCSVRWQDVYNLFTNMPVTDDFSLDFRPVDTTKVLQLLVGEHDFSKERVEQALTAITVKKDTSLNRWFS